MCDTLSAGPSGSCTGGLANLFEVPRILVTVPRGVLAQAKQKRFPVRLRMPSRLASPDSVSEAASILCLY